MRFLRWLIGLSFVFTIAAMFSLLRGGARHETERIIDLTVFEKPEQIGEALFRRNFPLYRETGVVILASAAQVSSYDRIWQGFINLAVAKGEAPKEVFSEAGLRDLNLSQPSMAGGPRIFQIVANDEAIRGWRQKSPRALIIVQKSFDATRGKKVNPSKLSAAAEIDETKVVNLYVNEPH